MENRYSPKKSAWPHPGCVACTMHAANAKEGKQRACTPSCALSLVACVISISQGGKAVAASSAKTATTLLKCPRCISSYKSAIQCLLRARILNDRKISPGSQDPHSITQLLKAGSHQHERKLLIFPPVVQTDITGNKSLNIDFQMEIHNQGGSE